jgi:uncharacterized protein (TIGR03067 family)
MYVFGGVDGQSLMISIQDPGSQAPRPTEISMRGDVKTSLIFLRPSDPNDAEREIGSFQGTWTLKNFDTGDEKKDPHSWPLPNGKRPDASGEGSELRWTVKGNEITWTSLAGEEIKASFTIDPLKSPKQIDFTFLSGRYKGETCPGIYQRGDLDPGIYQRGDLLDENILWLCMADPGSKTTRPKNFSYGWREGRSLMSLYPFEPPVTQTSADSKSNPSVDPAPVPSRNPSENEPIPSVLEFLKPYPKLHGLSLNMTEPQFLEIVKQQEMTTRKTVDGEKVTHHIALGDRDRVSTWQTARWARVSRPRPRPDRRSPEFGRRYEDNERCEVRPSVELSGGARRSVTSGVDRRSECESQERLAYVESSSSLVVSIDGMSGVA